MKNVKENNSINQVLITKDPYMKVWDKIMKKGLKSQDKWHYKHKKSLLSVDKDLRV